MPCLLFLAAASVFLQIALAMSGCPSATYNVTIKGMYSPKYLSDTPSNAHFSPLTVASHSPRFSVLVLHGYATDGIKEVAETGRNRLLLDELSSRKAKPFVKDVETSNGPFDGDETVSVAVMVDCRMSVITAVSMIAPSPDWIIAAANINMWEGRFFFEKKEGMLNVYDAGTDSGTTFKAPNKPTSPRENIAPLGAPFTRPAASYTIQRVRRGCRRATYTLTVTNLWTKARFPNAPKNMLSPLTAFSHSKRFSAFTLSGRASQGVKLIAEKGDNSRFLEELADEDAAPFIKDISTTDGPAVMGTSYSVEVEVDCVNTDISFISMLAPSPDWIVAQSSIDVMQGGTFVRNTSGRLFAYDAGTDSGVTPTAANKPTRPRESIARLQGAPFNGRSVGSWTLSRKVAM